jgi:RimJ/RimL family protein N-acetyltransferase
MTTPLDADLLLDCGECLVRPWREGDRLALLRYANNRNVWRNLKDRFPHPYTDADADAWFALNRSVPDRADRAIEVDKQAVGEPYWGRGIMTAAVRTVAAHTLTAAGFARLEASVYEWNPASMRVLETCGFAREGLLRRSVFKDDQLIDSLLYARLADGPVSQERAPT